MANPVTLGGLSTRQIFASNGPKPRGTLCCSVFPSSKLLVLKYEAQRPRPILHHSKHAVTGCSPAWSVAASRTNASRNPCCLRRVVSASSKWFITRKWMIFRQTIWAHRPD